MTLALCIALTSLLAATGMWLFAEVREGKHLRDRIEPLEDLADDYKIKIAELAANGAVLEAQIKQERTLRTYVEKQRDAAQVRVRELLTKHMKDASDEEIVSVVESLFAPFGVPASVPSVPSHSAASDDLERP